MNERIPPQDLDSEMALLGSMMMNRTVIDDVVPILPQGASAFALDAHGLIYDELVALHVAGKPMDLLVVEARLRDRGILARVGGTEYLIQLAESFADWANAPHYAERVASCHQARRCIQIADRLSTRAYTDRIAEPSELCVEAQAALDDVMKHRSGTLASEVRDVLPTLAGVWQTRKNECVRTGYEKLDTITGGFEKPSMVVLGARPSCGKTAMALAVCLQATRDYRPVLFFSLETTTRRIAERLTGMLSGHSVRRLAKDMSPDDQAEKISIAVGRMTGSPFYVVDESHSRSLREILATCRALHRRHKFGLIVIDYLQLIHADGKQENRTLEVTRISAAIKALTVETGAVVLALSQLNREQAGIKPTLGSLRESGAIEQDANMVILLHRDEYGPGAGNGKEDRTILFNLAKNKDGPIFEESLAFHAPTMTFWPSVEHRNQYGEITETQKAEFPVGMADAGVPW